MSQTPDNPTPEVSEPDRPADDFERQWPAIPTTCIETIGGDPDTAIRLSFPIKVF